MFSISPVFLANIYVPADFEDYCVNTLKKTALLSVLALYIPVSQAAAKEYSLDPQHTSVVISWNHLASQTLPPISLMFQGNWPLIKRIRRNPR